MHYPPTKRAMSKAFKDYLDDFMRLFLDDFIVNSDLDTHLSKLWKCFQEMSGVWNKSKPGQMCLHGILRHDTRLHSLKGGEAPRSKEG